MKADNDRALSLTELRERNTFLETLLNLSSNILYIYDIVETKNVYSNDGVQKILGYSSDEIKGFGTELIPLLMHPDDLQTYRNETLPRYAAAKDHEQVKTEYRMKHRDGTWRWLASNETIYLRNDDGTPKQVFGMIHDITTSKLNEETLQKQNVYIKSILDHLPIGIAVNEIDSMEVTYINDKFTEIYGWPKDEFTNVRYFFDKVFTDVEYRQQMQTRCMADIASGDLARMNWDDLKVTMKSGEKRIVNAFNIPMVDQNLMISTVQDITDRKQAEISLQKSQLLLQSSLESPQNMIIMSIDRNYRFLYFNKAYKVAMKEAYNINAEIGMNALDSITVEEDRLNIQKNVDRAMAGESHTTFRVHGDSEKSYYESLYSPIIDETNEIIGITVFALNVTERKQNELALAAEKERLAVTLRSIGDGVITTDANGDITMLNKAAEQLTGWTSKEAAGRPLPEVFRIINEITNEQCGNPVEKVLATGGIVELANHTCLIAKDGCEIIIADSGAPIRDKDSKIIGVVLVFRDMSEKQKLNDSMQRAQKLESLGVLAGGIAHDFNNLLGGIFGYLDMANESITNGQQEKTSHYLSKATGVFERARALTQQLLTFSKGGAPIRKTMPLAPLLIKTAQFALSGSNVALQLDIADDLWLCDCDENQIGQVLDNIVINAKQAMANGGKIIVKGSNVSIEEGRTGASPRNGNFVKIAIQDFGIGMPKEILVKIFDPFFSTKETGHGLGLATVFSIVQRHDGWVDVASEPGKGSTFHIFIPASQKNTFAISAKKQVSHKGNGTVLVMDDEEFMLEIVGAMFQNMGYAVDEARDGNEALRLFDEAQKSGKPYVACILDLTIPGGMGGKETVKKIRKINEDAIVFAASGYSEDPVMAKPTVHGFTDSIVKPFKIAEFAKLFELHLQ